MSSLSADAPPGPVPAGPSPAAPPGGRAPAVQRALVADQPWAVVVAAAIARAGGASAVLVVGTDARRTWAALRDPPPVRAESVAEPREIPDALAGSGLTGLPVVTAALPAGPALVVAADGQLGPDPLHWAVRVAATSARIWARSEASTVAATAMLPPDCGYGDAAEAVAHTAVALLAGGDTDSPMTSGDTDSAVASDAAHPAMPGGARLTRGDTTAAWSRIDWGRPAAEITRLVRASAVPGGGAWTWLHGVRVTIGAVRPTPHPTAPVPAGTILASTPDGPLVRAGDGVLLVSGVRDPIGIVAPTDLAPGTVFGADLDGTLVELAQRVRDLEYLVERMAAGASPLEP